jgi:fatty-acyl-CoA synthase
VVTQFATAKIGAILVNINPAYRQHELAYVLRQSGCSVLILAPGFRDANYVDLVVGADAPGLRQRVVLGEGWDELLARSAEVAEDALGRRQAELDFDQPINIQYTSGTTGFPKGATLSHHNILNNGFFIGEMLAYTPEDRVCVPVPFYHCFGMVLGNLAIVTHGATIVIPAEAFDARATLEAVAAERCTSLYGVPTMFIAELNEPTFSTFDLTSLRTGIMAGSPCPVEVMKRVKTEMHMDEVTICYGMTETSPVSTRHSRRREHLPARDRGVSVHTPRDRRRSGDRRSRRAVRRGGLRLGRSSGGDFARRGGRARLLSWEDRALQDLGLRQDRRLVSHDGDRQDPEVQDAGTRSRRAWARGSRGDRPRVKRPRGVLLGLRDDPDVGLGFLPVAE